MLLRLHGLGYLPNLLHDLGVAQKIVSEFRITGVEQSLTDRAVMGLVKRSGIPAFVLNYWSVELGGIERVGRDGKAIQYNFRYDPTNINRISLFRNGAWVGDGYAKELQQADGSYRQISLAEWKMMKHLVRSKEVPTEGKTPAELALVSDLQALSKQRTQEKKGAQRNGLKSMPPDTDEPSQRAVQATSQAPDVETERVLRFLHG